jgi:hypothetical protein
LKKICSKIGDPVKKKLWSRGQQQAAPLVERVNGVNSQRKKVV